MNRSEAGFDALGQYAADISIILEKSKDRFLCRDEMIRIQIHRVEESLRFDGWRGTVES